MSFASRGTPENRRTVTDLRELRALAHPLRLALLDHLMSFGEQTAARCAEAVGSTTSNCSYHLRALGRAGFVARADSADGRERPWRAVATGLTIGAGDPGDPGDPGDAGCPDSAAPSAAVVAAALTVDELSLRREEELTRRARRRHDEQPAPWRAAEAFDEYALLLTAAELARLTQRIDGLVRPYIAMTRDDVPAQAQAARLRLLAFRDPRAS